MKKYLSREVDPLNEFQLSREINQSEIKLFIILDTWN
jgi:hypothetical protein